MEGFTKEIQYLGFLFEDCSEIKQSWPSSAHFLSSLAPHPACGRRFYKSSSQDLQCSRCPTHSFSDREGSSRCECEDGYYRAPSDPPYVACTSKFKPEKKMAFTFFPFVCNIQWLINKKTEAGFKFKTFSLSYL